MHASRQKAQNVQSGLFFTTDCTQLQPSKMNNLIMSEGRQRRAPGISGLLKLLLNNAGCEERLLCRQAAQSGAEGVSPHGLLQAGRMEQTQAAMGVGVFGGRSKGSLPLPEFNVKRRIQGKWVPLASGHGEGATPQRGEADYTDPISRWEFQLGSRN